MANENRDLGSTVPRRQLGRELRKLRMEAGFTVEAAAQAIGRSAPTLWRMEKGGTLMRPGDVAGICRIYGADDRLTDALMALAAETKNPGWWRSHNSAIPKWFDSYVGLESAASRIRIYNDSEATGLLQTPRYAEAIFRAHRPVMTDAEVEERVTVRMERQKLLTRSNPPPPDLVVVVGESVLLRSPFDRAAMAEQLGRLIEASELPNISIRVLPLAKSLDCSSDRRFNLLEFPPDRRGQIEPPVAYLDTLTGALYLTAPAEIDVYNQVWESINAAALTESESLKVISAHIERYQ